MLSSDVKFVTNRSTSLIISVIDFCQLCLEKNDHPILYIKYANSSQRECKNFTIEIRVAGVAPRMCVGLSAGLAEIMMFESINFVLCETRKTNKRVSKKVVVVVLKVTWPIILCNKT